MKTTCPLCYYPCEVTATEAKLSAAKRWSNRQFYVIEMHTVGKSVGVLSAPVCPAVGQLTYFKKGRPGVRQCSYGKG